MKKVILPGIKILVKTARYEFGCGIRSRQVKSEDAEIGSLIYGVLVRVKSIVLVLRVCMQATSRSS